VLLLLLLLLLLLWTCSLMMQVYLKLGPARVVIPAHP
jgi:hypothetical protein